MGKSGMKVALLENSERLPAAKRPNNWLTASTGWLRRSSTAARVATSVMLLRCSTRLALCAVSLAPEIGE